MAVTIHIGTTGNVLSLTVNQETSLAVYNAYKAYVEGASGAASSFEFQDDSHHYVILNFALIAYLRS